MASSSARKKSTAALSPRKEATEPKPEVFALERIASLVARGSSPIRVRQEVDGIIDGWLANAAELEREEVRERLEQMQELLTDGLESAQTQIDDMDSDEKDGKQALVASQKALTALQAARTAVVIAAQRAG